MDSLRVRLAWSSGVGHLLACHGTSRLLPVASAAAHPTSRPGASHGDPPPGPGPNLSEWPRAAAASPRAAALPAGRGVTGTVPQAVGIRSERGHSLTHSHTHTHMHIHMHTRAHSHTHRHFLSTFHSLFFRLSVAPPRPLFTALPSSLTPRSADGVWAGQARVKGCLRSEG